MFQAFFTCSAVCLVLLSLEHLGGARNIPASASASGEINSLSSHMNKISLGSQDRNLCDLQRNPQNPRVLLSKSTSISNRITIPSPNHVTKYISFWWRGFQTGRTVDFLGGITAFLIKMKRNASDAAEASPQASVFPLFILAQASTTLPETPEYKDG